MLERLQQSLKKPVLQAIRSIKRPTRVALAVCALMSGATFPSLSQAWEPTKAVEFIVPAGTGGGADQMARFIQTVVSKHNLMKQPMVVLNKGGGAGAEGFLMMKGSKGDPHKLVITLSNLFTTPLATDVPFNWRDLTPLQMMALDQFVLWVNAEKALQERQGVCRSSQSGRCGQAKNGGYLGHGKRTKSSRLQWKSKRM